MKVLGSNGLTKLLNLIKDNFIKNTDVVETSTVEVYTKDETNNLLNNKTNIDADNLSATGKSVISKFGMPSTKYTNLTVGASGSTYTAPANGYFAILANTTNLVRFDGLLLNFILRDVSGSLSAGFVPVRKGQTIQLMYNTLTLSDSWNYFRFIYAEGENN